MCLAIVCDTTVNYAPQPRPLNSIISKSINTLRVSSGNLFNDITWATLLPIRVVANVGVRWEFWFSTGYQLWISLYIECSLSAMKLN